MIVNTKKKLYENHCDQSFRGKLISADKIIMTIIKNEIHFGYFFASHYENK